jgi:hypothetical protein
MTPVQFLDACEAFSWALNPDLIGMLDDDDFRNSLYAVLSAEPAGERHALFVALMHREMDYRARLWDRLVEDHDDRYENIYRCAFMLYRIGQPEDVFLLWHAKDLNMDVGSSLGVEYFIGAGVGPTLDHLKASDRPEAEKISAYIRGAFVTGDWLQWQKNWELAQSDHYWPT